MTCAAHAVFAMRRSRVGSRRFVQPELVQKLYRLFKLAAFFFFFCCVSADTSAACLVAQSGTFWQPELCFCQALGMPLGSRMSGKGLRRGGGSSRCVHKSRLIFVI